MFKKSLVLVICILLAVPPVFAQTDITYGDTVEGTISDAETPVIYQFSARAGDIVNVIALADDPDQLNLALDLVDPAGETVASVDDYYLLNPAFLEQILPERGIYQLVVRSESGTGGFLLFIEGETSLAPGDVLYEEVFDNNDKDWETNTDDEAVLFSDLVNGEYMIQYETTEANYFWVVAPGFTNWSAAPVFEPPYQVTVEVSDVESNSDAVFLMVLFQVQAEYQCYDSVSFYPNGRWAFYGCDYQARGGGSFDTAVDFRDGNTHTIGVQVDEYRLNLMIDDQIVSYPFQGLEYAQGSVGFGIGIDYDTSAPEGQARTAEAFFDNVVVRKME